MRYGTIWIKIQKKKICLYSDQQLIKSYETKDFVSNQEAQRDLMGTIAARTLGSSSLLLEAEEGKSETTEEAGS